MHTFLLAAIASLAGIGAAHRADEPVCGGVVPKVRFSGASGQRAGQVPFPETRVMPLPSRALLASADPLHLETRMRGAIAGGLGDVLRQVLETGDDRASAFARIARERRGVRSGYGWYLPQLLRTDGRASRVWEAREGSDDDGFYAPTAWVQDPAAVDLDAWPRARGESLRGCEIAALAFLGDEVTACEAITRIKRVERDLARYGEWRGLTRRYKRAKLARDTYERSPQGDVFKWRLQYTLKAFTSPRIEFTLRDRFEADGTFVTESFSTTERFGLLMGRTAYLPVYDSEGDFVALLLVAGMVSDQPVWLMRSLMRGNLGNLIERAATPTTASSSRRDR